MNELLLKGCIHDPLLDLFSKMADTYSIKIEEPHKHIMTAYKKSSFVLFTLNYYCLSTSPALHIKQTSLLSTQVVFISNLSSHIFSLWCLQHLPRKIAKCSRYPKGLYRLCQSWKSLVILDATAMDIPRYVVLSIIPSCVIGPDPKLRQNLIYLHVVRDAWFLWGFSLY